MAGKNIKGITIEIGGNTTGLDKALKDVEKGSNSAKSELKEVDRALKNAPQSAVLWAQKQELLTKAIEESKKKLELLENAQEQVEKQFQNKEIGEEQYRAFQREVENARSQLNEFRNNLDDTRRQAESAGEAVEDAGRNIGDLGENAEAAEEDVDDLGEAAEDAGDKAEENGNGFTVLKGALSDLVADGIRVAGSAMKEFTEDVVKTGITFESSMSSVAAISGATSDELEMLSIKAQEMGATTKFTASEAADAFGYMALAGWKTEDMIDGIDGILNLAAASNMDLANASDIVTDYLTAFGLTAQDSAKFADIMSYAMANSNTTTELLGEAYKNCAATAASMGYSVEETTAVIMTMANAGVKGGEAGTALNSIMTRLATNTKDCATALGEYGVNIYDSEGSMNTLSSILEGMSGVWSTLNDEQQAGLAKAIAGTNQYSALQTIMNGLSESAEESGMSFAAYSDALKECDGTAQDMSTTMIDNLEGDMTILGSAVDGMKLSLSNELTPVLRDTVQYITEQIPNIQNSLEKVFKKGADGVNWLVKHLPEIKDTAKKMLPAVEGVGAAFLTWKAVNGISQGIGLVKSLGTAVATLATNIKGISSVATLASSGVLGLVAVLAVGAGSYIYAAKKAHEAKLEEVFEKGTEEARNLANEINESSEKMNELKESAKSQIETDFSEIYKTENLYKELQDLVDENGNVKQGYEERVNYIRNELSSATGIEIGLVDGQIQKYQELQSTIEETLNKQRAQTMLNAYSGAYDAAIVDNQSASNKIMQSEDIIAENEAAINKMYGEAYKIAAANNKSIEHRGDFTYSNYDNWADIFNNQQWEQLHVAEENIRTAQSNIDSIGKQIEDNKYIIQQYEKAEGAFYDNKYSLAQGYASSIDDLDRAALSNNEKNLKERQDALRKSVDTAIRDYETRLKYGLTEGNEEIQESLAAIIKQCQESGMTMGEILSSGIVDELGQIDGFDSSKLIAFGRDYLGLTLGDSIGFMSRVALQPHIDAMRNEFTSILDGLSNLKLSADTIVSSTVDRFRNIVSGIPMMASGGTLHSGSAIVAEAGPELIEIMNGGARVTPLTGTARNTAAGSAIGQKVFYNTYNVTVEKISSDYDVKVLSQRLAAEQRKIESGKGK